MWERQFQKIGTYFAEDFMIFIGYALVVGNSRELLYYESEYYLHLIHSR